MASEPVDTALAKLVAVIKDVVLLNEIYSTNMYIHNTIGSDKNNLERTNRRAASGLHQAKMEYMTTHHHIQYKRYLINVMLLTLGVFSVCMLLMGYLFMGGISNPHDYYTIFGIIIGSIIVLYLVVMYLWWTNIKRRTNYNWNRIYFRPPLSAIPQNADA